MSTSDSKYNRSEKGKARYARYRAANREKINERLRAIRRHEPDYGRESYITRRRRDLGRQRERIADQLGGSSETL